MFGPDCLVKQVMDVAGGQADVSASRHVLIPGGTGYNLGSDPIDVLEDRGPLLSFPCC